MKSFQKQAFATVIFVVCMCVIVCHGSGFCSAPEPEPSKSFWPGDAWPNATLVYELHSTLNKDNIRVFHEAVADFESKTCIRFQQRANNETDYVSLERLDLVCGSSQMCRRGGYQWAYIAGNCFNKSIVVHELSHSLCLGHEDTRIDRDDYLDVTPCGPHPSPDEFDTRGHLFDYWSIMHYQCGFCQGGAGWPKMEGVTLENCGQAVAKGDGLSVLDADKLNDFYNCKGCFQHRWRRTNNLTEADLQSLLAFGQTNDGQPLYLCRAYVGAEIAPGKYNLEEDICYLSFNGTEYQVRERVQVFTVPSDLEQRSSPIYQATETRYVDGLVRIGRSVNGTTQYAAVATVELNGFREVAIGKVYETDLTQAYIPMQGKELVVTNFAIIGCES